jgi:potassium-dependent mechanosensitive channel
LLNIIFTKGVILADLNFQFFKDYSWDSLVSLFLSIWRTQLISVDGSPITFSKIIYSLIILIFGIYISKKLTNVIIKKLMNSFHLSGTVRYTIENVAYYTFVLFFFFFALRVSNIPLTVFNLIGGALAIGLGFGSQNIVNNFISGLIIIFERPIKIGDYIEINSTYGRVEEIGMRSTILSSTGNRHYIIPNSTILQSQVHNWTLLDHILRTSVSVGVAYGSPLDLVQKILHESVKKVDSVISEREVLIIFSDFADSSLNFEVYFYTTIYDHFSLKKAQSEVRLQIDKVFRSNSISIAFPQRDVNLYTSKPLDINLNK